MLPGSRPTNRRRAHRRLPRCQKCGKKVAPGRFGVRGLRVFAGVVFTTSDAAKRTRIPEVYSMRELHYIERVKAYRLPPRGTVCSLASRKSAKSGCAPGPREEPTTEERKKGGQIMPLELVASSVSRRDRERLLQLVRLLAQLGLALPTDTPSQPLDRVLDRLLVACKVAVAAREREGRDRIKRQLTSRQFSAAASQPPPYKGPNRAPEHGVFAPPSVQSRRAADTLVDEQAADALPWLSRKGN